MQIGRTEIINSTTNITVTVYLIESYSSEMLYTYSA